AFRRQERGQSQFESNLQQPRVGGGELIFGHQRPLRPVRGAVFRWQGGDLLQQPITQDGRFFGGEDRWARGPRRTAPSAVAMAAGRQLQSSRWSIDVAIYGSPVPPVSPARLRHPRFSSGPVAGAGAQMSGASRSSSPAIPTSANRAYRRA